MWGFVLNVYADFTIRNADVSYRPKFQMIPCEKSPLCMCLPTQNGHISKMLVPAAESWMETDWRGTLDRLIIMIIGPGIFRVTKRRILSNVIE